MFDPNSLIVIGFVVFVALAFDFINGFHDAANSVATIVSTRVLSPFAAVFWAGFFNFLALFIFKVHVATTLGKGIVDPSIMSVGVVFAALMGAIIWDLLTWWWGLPSSSSHALVGGFVGAAITKAGFGVLISSGLIKICLFIVLSPLLGMTFGFVLMNLINLFFQNTSPSRVDKHFRRLQLISASLYSLGHGGNDAQKTMGIITVLLFSSGYLTGDFYVPIWVMVSCHVVIALGTMMGGWRIVKTMGMKITKLHPVGGFAAEAGAATTLFMATFAGIPVSTTHTITGSIMGVGATRRLSAVRWGVVSPIIYAWIFTIPVSALIAAAFYVCLRILF
ncbi:MAG: inorganic phosphate transporter [Deltaproteobacteria bacterium RIFCSPLOWO2_12_FULL_40_28]|nr:MAG: inorganic phosphate transporter [Deltaproteobacteria bacterium RIFCSPHIGHO2_02_FULL_40_28]OGQ20983.1 MAG: inorganic phosphate transporter [Deltaproteobacteria bacterium RIFCSPHIGHO2_12_FULL_40_32]OGQ39384.1 MAG: inorganic phosphate transporter [Deltaproteobacteria bacterium RIFCSPLOWO2_02_FULL_40_36]OGQ54665.1 MAG: inorganic phosphate transporter [Deltaproteobacteria bacterium RIFCSPLOWO2_12_FULL_40_28]